MDKDTAFEKIKWILFAIENKNKDNGWKLRTVQETLTQLGTDSWNRGVKVGISKSIEHLKFLKDGQTV